MRIRRSFACILALLLTLTLGAAAAADGFTDAGEIGSAYRTAVADMSDGGVLNGFPDGSFRPGETLTREQGAKIVTYMVLGDGVDALPGAGAPFDDVAEDRWSAPCITWCVGRGILLGYGDGRFGPADTLTGDQFAKMLLCALDLAREGNYAGLGALWSAAVREDGFAAGLYQGDPAMASDRPINRQQAALLAWNALRAAAKAAQDPIQPPVDPPPAIQPAAPTEPGVQPLPPIIQPTAPIIQPTAPTTPIIQPPAVQPGGGDTETPEIPLGPGSQSPQNPGGTAAGSSGDIVLPEIP